MDICVRLCATCLFESLVKQNNNNHSSNTSSSGGGGGNKRGCKIKERQRIMHTRRMATDILLLAIQQWTAIISFTLIFLLAFPNNIYKLQDIRIDYNIISMKNVPLKSQTQVNIKTNQHQTSKFPSKQKYLKCTHVHGLNAMHRTKKQH